MNDDTPPLFVEILTQRNRLASQELIDGTDNLCIPVAPAKAFEKDRCCNLARWVVTNYDLDLKNRQKNASVKNKITCMM